MSESGENHSSKKVKVGKDGIKNTSEVIEIYDSEDDANVASVRKPAAIVDTDDEVQIVDAPISVMEKNTLPGMTKNDDIEVVGTLNSTQFSHMRPHCIVHPFYTTTAASGKSPVEENKKFCPLCYCYVCDVLVKDCKLWNQHFNACDKGKASYHWKQRRRQARAKAEEDRIDAAEKEVLFEGRLIVAKTFKVVMNAIAVTGDELVFELTKSGLRCSTKSSDGKCATKVSLSNTAFSDYQLPKDTYVRIVSNKDLIGSLKGVRKKSDTLLFKVTKRRLTLVIDKMPSDDTPETLAVRIELLNDYTPAHIPDTTYSCDAHLPSGRLRQALETLWNVIGRDELEIEEEDSTNSITMSSHRLRAFPGSTTRAKLYFPPVVDRENEANSIVVQINKKFGSAKFGLIRARNFVHTASALSKRVHLQFSSEDRLSLTYDLTASGNTKGGLPDTVVGCLKFFVCAVFDDKDWIW